MPEHAERVRRNYQLAESSSWLPKGNEPAICLCHATSIHCPVHVLILGRISDSLARDSAINPADVIRRWMDGHLA